MILKRIYRKSRFVFSFLRSLLMGSLSRQKYAGVKSFIIFVGYPRSGHSLIAALLDAHPETVISMEWGVLTHLRMGYGKNQVYYSIERNARLFTCKLNNIWTGYSYKVPGTWQGQYKTIRIIGDKLAGQTSLILKTDTALLERLQQTMGCPVKIIHVVRNPYDTITTMARRSFEKAGLSGKLDRDFLAPFIDKYFDRAAVVQKLKDTEEFELLDLYHEDMIKDSGSVLTRLLNFLEVKIPDDYIARCSECVYREPNKSRLEFDWPDDLKTRVRENIEKYGFMEQYRFED
jgi:hypothetical protein